MDSNSPHLLELRVEEKIPPPERFPFSLPCVSALKSQPLEFTAPVTLLLGENGSGKSSLLEAIAIASKIQTIGANLSRADESLETIANLVPYLRMSWRKKGIRGLFLRAEDYFGFVRRVDTERAMYRQTLREIDEDSSLSSTARIQARRTHATSLAAFERSYGKDGLDAMSHGESFLAFFETRLRPGGFYILDEPEAALSPMRCLSLLALVKDLVASGTTQLLIATHSPVLMAIPGAQIVYLENGSLTYPSYDEIPHVAIMRDFLRSPERFLRHF